jgi:hypothetical protein
MANCFLGARTHRIEELLARLEATAGSAGGANSRAAKCRCKVLARAATPIATPIRTGG